MDFPETLQLPSTASIAAPGAGPVAAEREHGVAALIEAARHAEAGKRWAEAQQLWTAARERAPDRSMAYAGESRALRQLGSLEAAERVLQAAEQRFPREIGVLHELARLAEQRRDWTAAERWWRACLAGDRRAWFAQAGLATALREQGRLDEAEALLLEAQQTFPQEIWPFANHARLAEVRQDWQAALARWTAIRHRFAQQVHGHRGSATALRVLGRLDEAEAVLLAARECLPGDTGLIVDLARVAETRRDWAAAEQLWRGYRALENGHWLAHTGLAAALREQARFDEAEAVLAEQFSAFAGEPHVFAEHAHIAVARRDWAAALDRWTALRDRFPDVSVGHVGSAAALRELGRQEEAIADLLATIVRRPDDASLRRHLCLELRRLERFEDAVEHARKLNELEGGRVHSAILLADSLHRAGKAADAEPVLRAALSRFPTEPKLHEFLVRVLVQLDRPQEAVAIARAAVQIAPTDPDMHGRLSQMLDAAGASAEAEQILRGDGPARLPAPDAANQAVRDEQQPSGAPAGAPAGWEGAGAWLSVAGHASPTFSDAEDALRVSALPIPPADARDALFAGVARATGLEVRDFVSRFESLGCNCEFSIIQRLCGAEPLGLARFAGISLENMTAGVNAGFAGLSEPGNLHVDGSYTWMVTDRIYGMRYHTFLKLEEVSREQVAQGQSRRLVYLRRKFLEDIAEADKIFIVWRGEPPLADADVLPLLDALRRRGPARLLYVVPGEPAGLVELVQPGLMRGRIDKFMPNGVVPPQARVPAWLTVLVNAWLVAARNP